MFQRPRWGQPRLPQQSHHGNAGNFQPPQHRARFPGPRQPHGFGAPLPQNVLGGFNHRVKGPGMFSGAPHHEIEEFGVPSGFNPRGQGTVRFNRPPPNRPGNMQNFQRPRFNGPQDPNFRPRFEMRPPPNNNHPSQRQHNGNHQAGQQQGFNKQKKPKVDKRDLPENNKYFCEVCDRGYKEEEKYKEHINGHEKCKYEGCNYTAAPRLVQLHINLQHRTGLAKKIWSLESPEDIKKWREERRKNFPTAENVEKKKAIMAEKVARGEVIEEKYFGKIHQRGKGRNERGRGRGRGQGRFQGERSNNDYREENKRPLDDKLESNVSPVKKSKKDTGDEVKDNVPNQAANIDANKDPLGYFYNALSDFDSDSENEGGSSKPKPPQTEDSTREVTAAGALGSLITSYGDSDWETADTKDDGDSTTLTKNEEALEKNESKPDKTKRRNRNRGRKNKNNNNEKNKTNHLQKDNKSLLEKLLAKEIRKERNQILQCVYHIVRNNFFDKSSVSGISGQDTSVSSNGSSLTSSQDT